MAMATIRTLGIEPHTEHLGNQVEVTIQARTSLGTFPFRFVFPDQGSAAANEAKAREDLGTLMQEALEALQRHE